MTKRKKKQVDVRKLNEDELRELVPTLLDKISLLEDRIAQLQRSSFGRRSEKARYHDATGMLPFAELAELEEELEAAKKAASSIQVPAHERTRTTRRKDFPDHLPRRTTHFAVNSEDLPCPDCGKQRVPFGSESAQELERIEFTYVHVIERQKCCCRSCEGNVIVADAPQRVIEKGLLGPGFLAQIIFERFGNHMPYARLEKKYKAEGLSLSRSVMCSSVVRCAELLEPVYRAHCEEILESLEHSVLQSDDTEVLQRNGREKGARKVHVWAWRDQHGGVFYTVTDTRNRDGPKVVLAGRTGRLQCDGHDCYCGLDPDAITRIGCWAHVRRYFETAKKRGDENAAQILAWIAALFRVEAKAKKLAQERGYPLTDDELLQIRRKDSKPQTDAIKTWADKAKLQPPSLPGGPLMKGVTYTINQWPTLIRFLEDGGIREISNNGNERALRSTVIGKKNWLWFGNEEGAKAGAIMMSLVQSCRELDINPLLYLRDTLQQISVIPHSEIRSLTPKGWKKTGEHIERRKQGERAMAEAVQALDFSKLLGR